MVLRPVWDWLEQFAERDIQLFTNPLYKRPVEVNSRQSIAVTLPPNAIRLPGLVNPSNRLTLNLNAKSAMATAKQPTVIPFNKIILQIEIQSNDLFAKDTISGTPIPHPRSVRMATMLLPMAAYSRPSEWRKSTDRSVSPHRSKQC